MLRYVMYVVGTLQLNFAVALPKDFGKVGLSEVLFSILQGFSHSLYQAAPEKSTVFVLSYSSCCSFSLSAASFTSTNNTFSFASNLATYLFAG